MTTGSFEIKQIYHFCVLLHKYSNILLHSLDISLKQLLNPCNNSIFSIRIILIH